MRFRRGDVVRVKTEWVSGFQNSDGEMDCWLGQIMTVDHVFASHYTMKEDNGVWCWFEEDLEPFTHGLYFLPYNEMLLRSNCSQRTDYIYRYAKFVCASELYLATNNLWSLNALKTRSAFQRSGVDVHVLPNPYNPYTEQFVFL